jgi:hypothetical protein
MSRMDTTPMKPGTSTAFGALKQVDAGLLSVGYAEAGPADGPAVLLLHGWPYDIHSFADVTITLEGDANGAPHPDASAYASKFTGTYEHRVIEGGIGPTCRKRLLRLSPKPSSTPTATDRAARIVNR